MNDQRCLYLDWLGDFIGASIREPRTPKYLEIQRHIPTCSQCRSWMKENEKGDTRIGKIINFLTRHKRRPEKIVEAFLNPKRPVWFRRALVEHFTGGQLDEDVSDIIVQGLRKASESSPWQVRYVAQEALEIISKNRLASGRQQPLGSP